MSMLPLLMELAGVYSEGYRFCCLIGVTGGRLHGGDRGRHRVGFAHARDDRRVDQHKLAGAQHQAVAGAHQTGVDEGGVLIHIIGAHYQGSPFWPLVGTI